MYPMHQESPKQISAREAMGMSIPDYAKRLSKVAKSLSDETRLRIIFRLAEGERTNSKLMQDLSMKEPAISHQLTSLGNADHVTYTPQGKLRFFRLTRQFGEGVKMLLDCMYEFADKKGTVEATEVGKEEDGAE